MQDVLCPQSCPMKCSLIITVRNIAGKINYITIDKTVKNKPNKKGTPRKRATQGRLFPRIVFLPVRLQGVSKTSWKRALVCGFTYFGLNQSAAIILLSNGGKSILAHSGFSLGILMLERVTRRLHDACLHNKKTKHHLSESSDASSNSVENRNFAHHHLPTYYLDIINCANPMKQVQTKYSESNNRL